MLVVVVVLTYLAIQHADRKSQKKPKDLILFQVLDYIIPALYQWFSVVICNMKQYVNPNVLWNLCL